MTVEQWLGKDNTLGIDIWHKKYQYNNETFDEWLDRVSGGDEELRSLIAEKKFLFGGRILANRGLSDKDPKKKITLSNCYVLPAPEDSIESIFDCAKHLARTYSYGGGCGVDLSKLAPEHAKVNNAANESSGAVSFMDLYSMVTGLISQNGRRGALMLSMDCSHPDIEKFIDIKNDLNKVTRANISVRMTDDFMNAVVNREPFDLHFKREETGEEIRKTIDARSIFHKLAENNWNMGEPGILFWDRIKSWNMLSADENFEYAGVNPCSEESLPAGGSCLLGSLNLSEFVDENGNFNFDEFDSAVMVAVIALNNVLDEGLQLHPLEIQRNNVRDWRQIGLGVFGLADMFIKMGVKYGSKESIYISDSIVEHLLNFSIIESANLSAYHQKSYPMYNESAVLKSDFLNRCSVWESTRNAIKTCGLYNSQILTIAPTGTLSTMLGVSGGMEAIFANSYERKTESLFGEDKYYKVYTPIVKKYMDEHGLKDDSDLPEYFVTAGDIDYRDRIAMQASWQNCIDASISSTINLPNSATVKDIENIYLTAWQMGLKGITVFRDGCKRAPILSTSKHEESHNEPDAIAPSEFPRGYILDASDELVGKKRKLKTGCGSLHCTAFFDPDTGELMETYLSKGSSGGCNNFMIGLSRMISLAARSGCGFDAILDQLNSCGTCPSYAVRTATKHDTSKGSCCPTAVAYALKDMYEEMQNEISDGESNKDVQPVSNTVKPTKKRPNSVSCPECGEPLIFEGGCNVCKACGWSKCS